MGEHSGAVKLEMSKEKPSIEINQKPAEPSNKDMYYGYKVELGKDRRKELEVMFCDKINSYFQDMAPRFSKIREWRSMFDMGITNPDWPWENSLHSKLAVIPLAIGGIEAKLMKMFFSVSKLIKATSDSDKVKAKLTKYENYFAFNYAPSCFSSLI